MAASTVLEHTSLLLSDVERQCALIRSSGRDRAADPAPEAIREAAGSASQLTQRLQGLRDEYESVCGEATRLCCSPLPEDLLALEGTGPASDLDPLLGAMQLDAVIKALGQAQFALMQAMHE